MTTITKESIIDEMKRIMKTVETKYACELIGSGFLAKVQRTDTIYVTFTTDITKAKLYSTKQHAIRALNYKRYIENRVYTKEDLKFHEMIVETTIFMVNT